MAFGRAKKQVGGPGCFWDGTGGRTYFRGVLERLEQVWGEADGGVAMQIWISDVPID